VSSVGIRVSGRVACRTGSRHPLVRLDVGSVRVMRGRARGGLISVVLMVAFRSRHLFPLQPNYLQCAVASSFAAARV
jgi:hypothetical protein